MVHNRGDDLLPVRAERQVLPDQRGVLAGTVEGHRVPAAGQGIGDAINQAPVTAPSLPLLYTSVRRGSPGGPLRKK